MLAINPLLQAVVPPPIPEAQAWAARYDGRHGPLLDLCQAAPGYAPHPELLRRAGEAAASPANARYGLINGDLALRAAYAADLSAIYAGCVEAEQVAITAGCNQAFVAAMLVLAQRGDNVLLPVPWFWNHQQTCGMLGIEARPLPCRAEAGFVPAAEDAARLIDARTRAVVLVTPNNPTGAAYSATTISGFQDLCQSRGIALILDETYRDFLPAGQSRAHDLFGREDWPGSLVQLYSFSKAYCVPGHRAGAIVADAKLIEQAVKALDCLHICPQRGVQAALTWAIDGLADWRAENRAMINVRGAAMREALERAPGWRLDSLGAFFAYVRHPFAGAPSAAVAERLATELGAAGLPGSAFGPGQEGHVRLAFANLAAEQAEDLAARLRQLG